MLTTFTIYALVGNKLYQARRRLHKSTIQPPKHFIQSPIRSRKTTNVENIELASSCYDMDIKARMDSPSVDPVEIEFCPMERGQSSHTHDSISHSVVPESHVARRYPQYALLFFVALICTWVYKPIFSPCIYVNISNSGADTFERKPRLRPCPP